MNRGTHRVASWAWSVEVLLVLGVWVRAGQAVPLMVTLPDHLAPDVLVAYPCDRDAGARVIDVSGAGLHGTLVGPQYVLDAERGRVLAYTGRRDHLVVPRIEIGGFTFSAWVKAADAALDQRCLLRIGDLTVQGNARGSLSVRAPGGTVEDRDWPLAVGRWCHVAVVCDGRWVTLYRDGQRIQRRRLDVALPLDGLLTVGGARDRDTRSWRGRLDDVLVLHRALVDADVAALYRAGLGQRLPAWRATGQIVIDALIDGASELHLLPDLVYWTNNSDRAKPGRHNRRRQATWINGRPWYPHWTHDGTVCGPDMSSAYGLTVEPSRYAVELLAVGSSRGGGHVERGRIEARREGGSLIVRFEDLDPGARWFRIRLYPWSYLDPVPGPSRPCRDMGVLATGSVVSEPTTSLRPRPRSKRIPALPRSPASPAKTPVAQAAEFGGPQAGGGAPEAMVIEAYIDDVSDLWIKADGLVWKNVTATAKPGRAGGRNEPTYVNGEAWYPHWIKAQQDRGIDLSERRRHPLKPGFYEARLVAVGSERGTSDRDREGVEALVLPESLVVRFRNPHRQARWYRILVMPRGQ